MDDMVDEADANDQINHNPSEASECVMQYALIALQAHTECFFRLSERITQHLEEAAQEYFLETEKKLNMLEASLSARDNHGSENATGIPLSLFLSEHSTDASNKEELAQAAVSDISIALREILRPGLQKLSPEIENIETNMFKVSHDGPFSCRRSSLASQKRKFNESISSNLGSVFTPIVRSSYGIGVPRIWARMSNLPSATPGLAKRVATFRASLEKKTAEEEALKAQGVSTESSDTHIAALKKVAKEVAGGHDLTAPRPKRTSKTPISRMVEMFEKRTPHKTNSGLIINEITRPKTTEITRRAGQLKVPGHYVFTPKRSSLEDLTTPFATTGEADMKPAEPSEAPRDCPAVEEEKDVEVEIEGHHSEIEEEKDVEQHEEDEEDDASHEDESHEEEDEEDIEDEKEDDEKEDDEIEDDEIEDEKEDDEIEDGKEDENMNKEDEAIAAEEEYERNSNHKMQEDHTDDQEIAVDLHVKTPSASDGVFIEVKAADDSPDADTCGRSIERKSEGTPVPVRKSTEVLGPTEDTAMTSPKDQGEPDKGRQEYEWEGPTEEDYHSAVDEDEAESPSRPENPPTESNEEGSSTKDLDREMGHFEMRALKEELRLTIMEEEKLMEEMREEENKAKAGPAIVKEQVKAEKTFEFQQSDSGDPGKINRVPLRSPSKPMSTDTNKAKLTTEEQRRRELQKKLGEKDRLRMERLEASKRRILQEVEERKKKREAKFKETCLRRQELEKKVIDGKKTCNQNTDLPHYNSGSKSSAPANKQLSASPVLSASRQGTFTSSRTQHDTSNKKTPSALRHQTPGPNKKTSTNGEKSRLKSPKATLEEPPLSSHQMFQLSANRKQTPCHRSAKRMHRLLKPLGAKDWEESIFLSDEEESFKIQHPRTNKYAKWAKSSKEWMAAVDRQAGINPISIFGMGSRPVVLEEVFQTPDLRRAEDQAGLVRGSRPQPDFVSKDGRDKLRDKWRVDQEKCGFLPHEGSSSEEVVKYCHKVGKTRDVSHLVWDAVWAACSDDCCHNSSLRQPWFCKNDAETPGVTRSSKAHVVFDLYSLSAQRRALVAQTGVPDDDKGGTPERGLWTGGTSNKPCNGVSQSPAASLMKRLARLA